MQTPSCEVYLAGKGVTHISKRCGSYAISDVLYSKHCTPGTPFLHSVIILTFKKNTKKSTNYIAYSMHRTVPVYVVHDMFYTYGVLS